VAENVCEFKVKIRSDNQVEGVMLGGAEYKPCDINLNPLKGQIIEMLVNLLRENRLKKTREFEVLGAVLYSVLFDNELGKAIHKELFSQDTELLRVELIFEEGQQQLASWPWEYLYCPDTLGRAGSGYFLATKNRLVLTRHLPLDFKPREIKVEEKELPLKILLVATGPRLGDKEKKLGSVEYEQLLEELRKLEKDSGNRIELSTFVESQNENGLYKVTFSAFVELVFSMQPHVIHFIGHGQFSSERGGEIFFMKENGELDPHDSKEFANELSEVSKLRLVFLQACESGLSDPYQALSGVAMRLAHINIPAVVAMQYCVKQQTAIQFARAFYEALANSKTIGTAVQEGRRKIWSQLDKEDKQRGFGLPVLYMQKPGALIAESVIVQESAMERSSSLPAPEPLTGRDQMNTLICPWCNISNKLGEKYCGNCGASICCPDDRCKEPVISQRKFCGRCGNQLKRPKETMLTPPSTHKIPFESTPQSERKSVQDIRVYKDDS
jgi:hypothetical protein